MGSDASSSNIPKDTRTEARSLVDDAHEPCQDCLFISILNCLSPSHCSTGAHDRTEILLTRLPGHNWSRETVSARDGVVVQRCGAAPLPGTAPQRADTSPE